MLYLLRSIPRRELLVGLVASGIVAALLMLMVWPVRSRILHGHNDFLAMYAAAALVGSGELYDADAVDAVQRSASGVSGQALRVIRLPFHAVLISPLRHLPFNTAYLTYSLVSASAFAVFAMAWRRLFPAVPLIAYAASVPAVWTVMNGQDVTFLLLWIGMAGLLLQGQKSFWAGLALSLCTAKFHLLVLLPLWVLSRREWRFLSGFVTGVTMILMISFAVESPDWPLQLASILRTSDVHPARELMPTLHAALVPVRYGLVCEVVIVLGVAAAVWRISSRYDGGGSLAITIAAGVLVGQHAYLADTALFLPACVALYSSRPCISVSNIVAGGLLFPVAYLLLLGAGHVGAILLILGMMTILLAASVEPSPVSSTV